MDLSIGITAALIAFLAWGFGDFSIQRTVRAIGSIEALFFIGITGAVVLLPFVAKDLPTLFANSSVLSLLTVTTIVTLIGALLLFTAYREGKLSVIEPIQSLELFFTVFISFVFLKEFPTVQQMVLIGVIFIGITFIVIHREQRRWWQWWKKTTFIERGIGIAFLAAFFLALINVLIALSSRSTNPLIAIWFTHGSIGILCAVWLVLNNRFRHMLTAARSHVKLISIQNILDNAAWIAYAKAVLTLPVSITIAITESYIALAAILGIVVNREKLSRIQLMGVAITLSSAIILAIISW